MIDNWFNSDINDIYTSSNVVVFIDESKEARFLVDSLVKGVKVFETKNEFDELKVKYEIEKGNKNENKYFIYTSVSRGNLKFIREYCETNGCVEIKYLDHYLKKKVAQHLNLNINLPKEELISAAKVSVGKGKTYWMDLSHKGATEIFDLEKELLPFLDNPKNYLKKFDNSTQEIFFKKVNELIDQEYLEKPANTLATEVVKSLLDGLFNNNPHPTLLNIYHNWLDSLSYKKSFQGYLSKYKLSQKSKIFEIHPSHPFQKIDEQWLKVIGENITNEQFISSIIPKINQRIADKSAQNLEITFWSDVKTLLEFDAKDINQLSSFKEVVEFYTRHFYKVDRAIRRLYSSFLHQKNIIEPIQEYYKSLTVVFLDKWFKYIDAYSSNQTGTIQKILDQNEGNIAIIVGDGVSWEFAKDILDAFDMSQYSFEKNIMLAGLPSETEHNMSQLYVDSGLVLGSKKEREEYLVVKNPNKEIAFTDLEKVNESTSVIDCLICSCKDPDKLGESYQQSALKYFLSTAKIYADKINQLLRNGFKSVYLVTDHGYTLTGILENSDKIDVNFSGVVSKSERFIRTKSPQDYNNDLLIEREIEYKEFKYCYFAKRLGPFKSPGVYGFSHGGLSPQETLIPSFKWSNNKIGQDLLNVRITNKSDLLNVTGELFSLKLIGETEGSGLFSMERKVVVLFFSDGKKFNESDILTIEKGKEVKKEYQFNKHSTISVVIVDAITKSQLDKATITQNSARDLGGLL
ncbi:hypothetical protein AAGF08_09705 [Algoriphagus sp. SE2]|uniref:hypothetical protein n=1 Tax=Algoriphagus sp. SE2 TaxID=3141536 RepID=UPI0031CCE451